eukprot:1512110-Pyramimonas_sp.AAC.1
MNFLTHDFLSISQGVGVAVGRWKQASLDAQVSTYSRGAEKGTLFVGEGLGAPRLFCSSPLGFPWGIQV